VIGRLKHGKEKKGKGREGKPFNLKGSTNVITTMITNGDINIIKYSQRKCWILCTIFATVL
jgi:hypothetical protein